MDHAGVGYWFLISVWSFAKRRMVQTWNMLPNKFEIVWSRVGWCNNPQLFLYIITTYLYINTLIMSYCNEVWEKEKDLSYCMLNLVSMCIHRYSTLVLLPAFCDIYKSSHFYLTDRKSIKRHCTKCQMVITHRTSYLRDIFFITHKMYTCII